MRVTFDSNVWRMVASPHKFPINPSISDFQKINDAIKNNKIEAFISETIFTLEGITKKDRKNVISNNEPAIDFKENETADGKIGLSFSIGPGKSSEINLVEDSYLRKHLDDAIKIGIKIKNLPRIAGFKNTYIEPLIYKQSEEELGKYFDKAFEVSSKIENNKAGFFHIKELGEKYNDLWSEGLKIAPESELGNIAKATAEWADGDSIAICIGLNCDYFCTKDEAKKAGNNSVLSQSNLKWLSKEYGLKVISPEGLAKLI